MAQLVVRLLGRHEVMGSNRAGRLQFWRKISKNDKIVRIGSFDLHYVGIEIKMNKIVELDAKKKKTNENTI